jgi:two-component system sensor histidine kinase KdpD
LDEIISAAMNRLRKVIKHKVEIEVPKELDPARADRALLEQVLINLLENAAKYSPASSVIKVTARQDGSNVFLAVQDEGPGIPVAERNRVFDLFFRAQHRDSGVSGSGLGLAICKGFVEAMGGKIAALDGHGGHGSTFEISLPIDASSAETTTQ